MVGAMLRANLATKLAHNALRAAPTPAAAVQTTLWITQQVEGGDVAVAPPQGTAHVVWAEAPAPPGQRTLHYCRLPRGAC